MISYTEVGGEWGQVTTSKKFLGECVLYDRSQQNEDIARSPKASLVQY